MRLWPHKQACAAVEKGLPKEFPRLWRYALALVGTRDGADDLTQAACLRAIERCNQFRPGSHLDRWLFRMIHNLWISDLRKETIRRGGGIISIDEAEIAHPGQSSEDSLLRKEIMMSVLRLPEAQRATVMLVYIEGYAYKDAAMILDIPIGTVMSRLATARSVLGHKFSDAEGKSDAK